jgi:ABC-type multidrug transport system fused ATPase/permease subunit
MYKKTSPAPVVKNWHFYAKLGVVAAVMVTTIAQAAFQIERFQGVWFRDFRFWTTVVNLVSLLVIGFVQYAEHWRLRYPHGSVLVYWLLFAIVYAVKLRSLVSQQMFRVHVAYFSVFTASFGLGLTELILEWLVPKKVSSYDALGAEDECPLEYANIFSALTFSWMTPMMKYGYKEYLTQDDLWNLRKGDTTRATAAAFEEEWEYQLENKKRPSLWIALISSFGGPYLVGAIIKTLSDCLAFVQPQLLRFLIAFVDSYRPGQEREPPIKGAAIAIAMFVVSVAQTACLHQYFQRSFETGMRVKSSLTAAIYSKSMKLSNEGRATKSTGDIVNHMAVDTQRLQDLAQFGQQLWSAPLQITLCMLSLYQLVGPAMFAGVGVMVLMVPINGFIAKISKNLQKKQMKNKDARTRLMTEILNNMKSIKLYAWTSAFMNKLNYIRNDQELHTLRKIGGVTAVANFTWNTTPFLVSCSTFAVFVATSDKTLSTDIVFPALTLFNMLGFPLAVLPMVITAIVEASVAVNRLASYFTAPELQSDAVLRGETVENGEEAVRVRDATFTWNKDEERHVLRDINFTAHKGELTCIVGRVGAGKSSFLQTLLGDLYKTRGEVVVRGSVAYVAQSPWVMNASVRENIVFGHRWDPQFYDKTIHACALTEDFASLPDGDQTQVGERGISLSGGQKARLTLARAVYARADIYLLDDILSAVDQHVGRHIIDNVLGAKGLLASKTRILGTNAIPVLMEAHFIVLLKDGKILERGTYEQLIAMKGEVATLIKTSSSEESNDEGGRSLGPGSPYSESTIYEPDSPDDPEEQAEAEDGLTQMAPIRPTGTYENSPGGACRRGDRTLSSVARRPRRLAASCAQAVPSHTKHIPLHMTRARDEQNTDGYTGGGPMATRKTSNLTLRRASTASFRGPRGKVIDEEENKGNLKSRQSKEFSEQGKVKWDVYKEYAKNSNLVAVTIYMITLIGAKTAEIGKWPTHLAGHHLLGCAVFIGHARAMR